MEEQKGIFDSLKPQQVLLIGFVQGILVLCTIGFFILLNMALKGNLDFDLGRANDNLPGNALAGDVDPGSAVKLAPIGSTDHVLGNKNAKVTLVEYSDFECPYCGQFYPTVKQAMKEYEGKVRLVYRHFPLVQIHPQAEPAALASECADEQGKFWQFHDKLFENQGSLSDAYYTQIAKELGLNASKFADCVKGKKYESKVQSQAASGSDAGVRGTPHTLVVSESGKVTPVSGAQPYSALKNAIEQALAD
ncbi:MAG: thioredoxin domain-containing protein [Patescibacteria group bacterium]